MTKAGWLTFARDRVLAEGFEFEIEGHDPRTQDSAPLVMMRWARGRFPGQEERIEAEILRIKEDDAAEAVAHTLMLERDAERGISHPEMDRLGTADVPTSP